MVGCFSSQATAGGRLGSAQLSRSSSCDFWSQIAVIVNLTDEVYILEGGLSTNDLIFRAILVTKGCVATQKLHSFQ